MRSIADCSGSSDAYRLYGKVYCSSGIGSDEMMSKKMNVILILVLFVVLMTAAYVVYNMAIRFYEEVMMRGLVLNNFINLYGDSKKGIIYSVCISSLIFGVAHLCNLVELPQLINATLSQVLYASFIGMFFASVYLRLC